MAKKLLSTIALAAAALSITLSISVMAAAPIRTNEKGEVVYSVTENEYAALLSDVMAYNAQQMPEYVASYSGINFYRRPCKRLIRETLKDGSIQVWYEDTEKITMYDTSGVIITNPDGTSETGTIPAYTNFENLTIQDADTIGADFLNDTYGLYCQTYLLTSSMARKPVYGGSSLNGKGTIYFSAAGMYDLFSQEKEQEQAIFLSLQKYVTNGMTKDDAISALIRYISDTIAYDYGTSGRPAAHPGTSLNDGLGICQDYAGAFCFSARLVPFDSNGFVNWERGTRNQLEPQWICTNTHAFNKIVYDGRTRWIDICYYDTAGGARWLDMGTAELTEANHANIICTYF